MVIVSTIKGRIEGIKGNICYSFLGIPYAKPPIGNLRFCEPQPMDAWDHIIKTVEYGPAAWQNHEELSPIQQEQNEDCLYLNIWTPSIDDNKRPVMFYIHGGGFLIGAGSRSRLNGEKLAFRGDVVVVTFNYRLGALGFLNLPNIPSNIGFRDQIAALEWVRDNIQNFGGDPNNITIFGESSGSESVVIFLSIPSTIGKFHRAIMQSGVANPYSYRKELTRNGAKQLLSKLRIEESDVGALKEININRFMRAQKKIAGVITDDKQNPFRPFVDEDIIPEIPYKLIQNGNYNKVPLILGWN
ncbi:MAG: carboxylesterase/lipase family protein, partial [Promethearchaeota archaeon]